MSRRTGLMAGSAAVVVAVVAVVVVAVSGGGGVSAPPVSPTSTPPPAAAESNAAGSTVVVAMGDLSDPSNTFYELFGRPAGSTSWRLATPPGVADNGGLVIGASQSGAVTAGFLPSDDLTFSVLAQRAASTAAWVPGDVPGTLAPEPDALAAGPSGQVAAVLSRPVSSVIGAGSGLADWSRLATAVELARASDRCAVTRITAVAVTISGVPVVGASCARSATIGLFVPAGRSDAAGGTVSSTLRRPTAGWSLVGPVFSGRVPDTTSVLRLQAGPGGVSALVSSVLNGVTTLTAMWGSGVSGTDAPTTSLPLRVPPGWSVLGTAMGGGDGSGETVLLGSGAARRVEVIGGVATSSGERWTRLTTPPGGTTAVASVGGSTDAFVPSGSHLSIWSTAPGAAAWTKVDQQSVPIQFGSSR